MALGLLLLIAAAVVVCTPELWLGRETGMLCCRYSVKMATFCGGRELWMVLRLLLL